MKLLRRIHVWQRRDQFEAVKPWSVKVAIFFDRLAFTANRMTLLGLLLCLPCAYVFSMGFIPEGMLLMTLSLLTDWFDGSIARYQEETYRTVHGHACMTLDQEMQLSFFQRVNFRGMTHMGRWLDPIVDKVRTFTFLFTVGYTVVAHWIIWSIVIVAMLLTCLRPLKQWLKLDHGGSNRFGKYKIWTEVIAMAAVLFLRPWSHTSSYVLMANAFFFIAFLFGLSSLFGHLVSGRLAYRKRTDRTRPVGQLTRETTRL